MNFFQIILLLGVLEREQEVNQEIEDFQQLAQNRNSHKKVPVAQSKLKKNHRLIKLKSKIRMKRLSKRGPNKNKLHLDHNKELTDHSLANRLVEGPRDLQQEGVLRERVRCKWETAFQEEVNANQGEALGVVVLVGQFNQYLGCQVYLCSMLGMDSSLYLGLS